MSLLRHFLWWMGAAPGDIIAGCDPCLQRRHTARGLVFALDYLFLVCVWIDVGVHYFGWIGVICPGLIVPSILVLGLGRLIAMHRPLFTGHGSGGEPKLGASSRVVWAPRVVIAVVLSTTTTLSLMMIQSRDLIHRSAVEAEKAANSALYAEKVLEVNSTFDALKATHQSHVDALTNERVEQVSNLDAADAAAKDANAHLEEAVREKSFEKGGLDSRLPGPGIKFNAWKDLGTHYQGVVDRESAQKRDAAKGIRKLDESLRGEQEQIGKLEAQRQKALGGVGQAIRHDVSYVRVAEGFFSDATFFLGLYQRADVGPGMWASSIVVVLFLFVVELSDLIAVSLSPCEIVPLGEWASVRLASAKLIAGAEIELARCRASRPAPWIEASVDRETEEDSGTGDGEIDAEEEVGAARRR